MRNACITGCVYYHKENNTCQAKKCSTGGPGYISWADKLFCKPVIREEEPCDNCMYVEGSQYCLKHCPYNYDESLRGEQDEK